MKEHSPMNELLVYLWPVKHRESDLDSHDASVRSEWAIFLMCSNTDHNMHTFGFGATQSSDLHNFKTNILLSGFNIQDEVVVFLFTLLQRMSFLLG